MITGATPGRKTGLSEKPHPVFGAISAFPGRAVGILRTRLHWQNGHPCPRIASGRVLLAKDPIFFKGGDTDLYRYVQNDPVNLIDPRGLTGEEVGRPFVPLSITPNPEADALREGAEPIIEAQDLERIESSEEAALTSAAGALQGVPDLTVPDNFAESPDQDWNWKGTAPPESGKGNWVNEKTGQRLHPDSCHLPPKGPHWGLTNPDGTKWDYFPGSGWKPSP